MVQQGTVQKASISNHILAALPQDEYKRILPYLEEVVLAFGANVYNVGDAISHVYFPNSGIISMLAAVDVGSTLDLAMVGNEGMIGLSLFLGVKTTMGRAIVLGKGTAMRMKRTDFENECANNGSLPRMLNRFVRSIVLQIMQSSVCYRFHSSEKRLACWLMMISNRMESDSFKITHDSLSNLVGVRRETITFAAQSLRKQDLITYGHGKMAITDRPGLEAAACNCYSIMRNEEMSFPVAN